MFSSSRNAEHDRYFIGRKKFIDKLIHIFNGILPIIVEAHAPNGNQRFSIMMQKVGLALLSARLKFPPVHSSPFQLRLCLTMNIR